MAVFKDYSAYYDLLYQNKDYDAEADYVTSIIRKFNPEYQSILEIGCGTGKHAASFSKLGFDVMGIDKSSRMIQIAKKNQPWLDFQIADIRYYDAYRKYDAVTALFHVISYLTTDDDLQKAINSISKSLRTGGIFVFDCWYGPAVLTDPPVPRLRIFENSCLLIRRKSIPEQDLSKDLVNVHFNVEVTRKGSDEKNCFTETHPMRYFFVPAIQQLCQSNNIEIVYSGEWMSGNSLSDKTWYACFGGIKK